jgi:predicted HAD superfamily Cof-like phosphohydrolase
MNKEKTPIDLVEEFHETFGAPVYVKPTLPTYKNAYEEVYDLFEELSRRFKESTNDSRSMLRMKLIFEEFKELCEAIADGDFVGIVDGLSDLRYVTYGTYHEFGLGPIAEAAFNEVHRSNMSKLGKDGKPIYRADGKVLKGPNFTKPNIALILKNQECQDEILDSL